MSAARMNIYGWGREGEGMSAEERAFVLGRYREKFGARHVRNRGRAAARRACPARACA